MFNNEKAQPIKKRKKMKVFFRFLTKRIKEAFEHVDFKIAIKITLTALLSLYVCLGLDTYFKHPEYIAAGLWCVVASIVVLQTNIGGTYKAIWNRFIGVLIGSALGAFFAFEFGAEAEMVALAIFITIVLCSLLGIQDSYRMAALSVAIIMIPWKLHPTSDPWAYAFFRFLDTCLGFVIAIFVSYILWPSQALNKMRVNMADMFNLFRQFFEHLLIPTQGWNKSHKILETIFTEIDQAFIQSRTVLDESKVELLIKFAPAGVWLDLMNCQERLWESLRALQSVLNTTVEEVFDEQLKQRVHEIVETIDFALKELALKLKTEKTSFDFEVLKQLQDSLQQELVRFRSTHTIKRYSLEIVENYFVFFYQIKQILQTLYQFNQLLDHLGLGKNTNSLEG